MEKIRGLMDVPPGKLATVLADSVPGLAGDVIEDLAATGSSLDRQGVSWQFDPTLVRGMGYYTGQVFEIMHPGMTSSVAGGGRYDQLIGRSLGRDVPACGFSLGFERIYTLMEERAMFATTARAADVLIAVPRAEALGDAIRLAAELRGTGLRVDCFPQPGTLGPQFELAQRKGIPFAVVIEPDAVRAGTLKVRDLATRRDTAVARDELGAWVRGRLPPAGD